MNVIEKLNSIKNGELTAKENVEHFLKVIEENGEEFLDEIEDDDEYESISEIFMERLEDLYDFES